MGSTIAVGAVVSEVDVLFRSFDRSFENKRVVWGIYKGANSDVFFPIKHTHKTAQQQSQIYRETTI